MTDDVRKLRDAADWLLVVLANVSGGDWSKQTEEWQIAAARWRDNYFAALAALEPAADPSQPAAEQCGASHKTDGVTWVYCVARHGHPGEHVDISGGRWQGDSGRPWDAQPAAGIVASSVLKRLQSWVGVHTDELDAILKDAITALSSRPLHRAQIELNRRDKRIAALEAECEKWRAQAGRDAIAYAALEREKAELAKDAERLLKLSKMIPSETWERLTGHWPTSDDIDEYRAAIDARAGGANMSADLRAIREALDAGYDCGLYGPNTRNCHFSLFATQEMTKAWERGKREGEAARALGEGEGGEKR